MLDLRQPFFELVILCTTNHILDNLHYQWKLTPQIASPNVITQIIQAHKITGPYHQCRQNHAAHFWWVFTTLLTHASLRTIHQKILPRHAVVSSDWTQGFKHTAGSFSNTFSIVTGHFAISTHGMRKAFISHQGTTTQQAVYNFLRQNNYGSNTSSAVQSFYFKWVPTNNF